MSSLEIENIILTVPDGSSVGSQAQEIDIQKITVDELNVTGTINGQAIVGDLVFTDSVQTLTNKTFADDTCAFADAADPTIGLFFDAGGATGTAAVLQFLQAADRTYSVPDSGADCNFVMTEGAQTVNGTKTFSGLTATGFAADDISEITPDHGVVIDNIRLRDDTLVTPAITVASIVPVAAPADVSICIVPKGGGFLSASIPTNTAAGGNNRGDMAVDLQMERLNPTEVASGSESVISGGRRNTSSGILNFNGGGLNNNNGGTQFNNIMGGQNNSNTGSYNAIGGGLSNANSGSLGFIGSGQNNTQSGLNNFIGCGENNNNTASFSVISGGSGNTTSGGSFASIIGGENCNATQYSIAGGRRAKATNVGTLCLADDQNADLTADQTNQANLRYQNGYRLFGGTFALNNVAVRYSDGSQETVGAVTADLYTIPASIFTNIGYFLTANVIAGNVDTGETAAFRLSIRARTNSGTTTLGAPFDVVTDADASLAAAAVAFVLSGNDVILRVTGVAADTVQWNGELTSIQSAF